ncbi:hypothetical protein T439DRAFT_323138 [Meredithblackwellia eburnea MCA 4105]
MANNISSPTLSVDVAVPPAQPKLQEKQQPPIWYSNTAFFLIMHLVALQALVKWSPWSRLDYRTAWMCFVSWQLATYGITIGYHRLWSHRSFKASMPLKVVLAGMGCLGFQGSIKWWVLRHRLHHRFTDTEHDPYNANRGLYYSHMGWIFRRPTYPRLAMIDKSDLDADPVVRFQHKHYLPLTLGLGLVLPTLIGWSYGDAKGGFLWGGVMARLLIWHCTFCINSLAHYWGDQEYELDVTARGNLFLAIFTGGEANHNYHHAFPRDYRNGPKTFDWDPTKWTIYLLHTLLPSLIPQVHETPSSEIERARVHIKNLGMDAFEREKKWKEWGTDGSATSDADGETGSSTGSEGEAETESLFEVPLRSPGSGSSSTEMRQRRTPSSSSSLPTWTLPQLLQQSATPCPSTGRTRRLLLISSHVVDVSNYIPLHPGGAKLLLKYTVRGNEGNASVLDATRAFEGGENDHGWNARRLVEGMRIAKFDVRAQ